MCIYKVKRKRPSNKVTKCKVDSTVVTYKKGKITKIEYILDCKKVRKPQRTAGEVLIDWLYR